MDNHILVALHDDRTDARILPCRDRRDLILVVGRIIFGVRIDSRKHSPNGRLHRGISVDRVDILRLQFLIYRIEYLKISRNIGLAAPRGRRLGSNAHYYKARDYDDQ